MPFTQNDFNNLIQQIGTTEDETTRRELLASLSDGVTPIFDDITSLTETNTQLTNDNETLRSANMKLFLRVGGKSEEEAQQELSGHKKPPEKRKFEDLFDEKGGIK